MTNQNQESQEVLGLTPEEEAERHAEHLKTNDLMGLSNELSYSHEKDLPANVEDLIAATLKIKFRTWYMPDINRALAANSGVQKALPDNGKQPERHHIHRIRLEAGQLRFFDRDGREIVSARVDITGVFLAKDELEYKYGFDEWSSRRRRARMERVKLQRQSNNFTPLALAMGGLPNAPKLPKAPPAKPIDPDEARSLSRVMEDIDVLEKEREEILEQKFAKEAQEKWKGPRIPILAPAIDGIGSLFQRGYNIEVPVDRSVATFSDQDWSPEGKFKYVHGRETIQRLLDEEPIRATTLPYVEFLKTNDGLLEKAGKETRNLLTGNFQNDLKRFRDFLKRVERAEKDPRYQQSDKNLWLQRDGVKIIAKLLEEYEKERVKRLYTINPFVEHHWGIDEVRDAIQENRNEYISFDHIAERLYNKNFELIKQKLEAGKIPKVILDQLHGDDIEDDFTRIRRLYLAAKQIQEKAPEERKKSLEKADKTVRAFYEHLDDAKTVYDILGDYVVYSVRLVRAIEKLKYIPPAPLSKQAYKKAGGNIFDFNRDQSKRMIDKPEMARSKALLFAVFKDQVDQPTLYLTFGTKFIRWLSGENPSPPITMEDFNKRRFSIDRSWFTGIEWGKKEWFTKYNDSDSLYKLVYEFARVPGTPETEIDASRAIAKLKDCLQIGIAAYQLELGDNFPDLLERHGIISRGRRDEDIQALKAKLEKNLDDFFSHLKAFQKKHPNFDKEAFSDFLEGEREAGRLSQDLLNFIRFGGVIAYRNGFLDKNLKESPKYHVKLPEGEIKAILAELQKTGRFTEEELKQVKEDLMLGVVVTNNGIGVGAAIPLKHGYSLDIAAGFFGGALGVAKETRINKKWTLTIHAGGLIGEHGVTPGMIIMPTREFEAVSVSGVIAATPIGFYIGAQIERRPERLVKKEIDRVLAERHIDELDRYEFSQRYEKVEHDPDGYPEFREVLYVLNTLGVDEASKRVIFESFYELYKNELKANALAKSFPIFRGVGLGAAFSLDPLNNLSALVPIKLGVMYRTLVFRVADSGRVERGTTEGIRKTFETLKKQYDAAQGKVDAKKTIRLLDGKIQIDEHGNLTLSKEKGGYLEINPFKKERDMLSRVESDLEIEVGQTDKDGLIPLHLREAYGEVRVLVDPDVQDKVLVVTDGNQLYLSVHRDAQIFISREDITFPFKREGATEITYLTIKSNHHVDRIGPGGVEARSKYFLSRMPGMQWRVSPELASEDLKTPEKLQVLTLNMYLKRAANPEFMKERLSSDLAEKWEGSMKGLAEAVSRGSFESEKPPEGFERALNELKSDPEFIKRFREKATLGFDYKEKKAKPEWNGNLPELHRTIKDAFAQKGIPPEAIKGEALQRATTEFFIESVRDFFGKQRKESLNEAYHAYLEAFERPLLTSVFTKYYKEKRGLSQEQADTKGRNLANYLIAEFYTIQIHEGWKGEPMRAGAFYATTAGLEGLEGSRVTGLRTLYNPHETSDTYGVIFPANLEFKPNDKVELRREIARFWIEHFSDLPDGRDALVFSRLLDPATPREGEKEATQNIHRVLRTPLCLQLSLLYAGASGDIELIEGLTKAYRGEAVSEGNQNIASVRKFLEFCLKVREAQLAGKPELKIEGTPYTLVPTQKLRMGIYKRCANMTAAYEQDFGLREEGRKGVVFVVREDGVVATGAGTARKDFGLGLFLARRLLFPQEEAAPRTPEPTPTSTPTPEPKPIPPTPPSPGERVIPPKAQFGA